MDTHHGADDLAVFNDGEQTRVTLSPLGLKAWLLLHTQRQEQIHLFGKSRFITWSW